MGIKGVRIIFERFVRPKHAVSTKVAIYSHDGERALIMSYPGAGKYGLPGGHVELGEHPDETLVREVEEELGVTIKSPLQKSFFRTHGQKGRLILAYTYNAPDGFATNPPAPDLEHDLWLTRDELADIGSISEEYRSFVFENWPS